MNEPDTELSLSLEREIDVICREFERQWRAKEEPRIEEFVERVRNEGRSAALTELIAQEADMRQAAGESVKADQYHKQFPANRDEVDAAFDLLQRSESPDPADAETGNSAVFDVPETHDMEQKPTLDDEPDPASIGRYKIQERIGQGAFGRVYRAWDDDLQRDVAIKVSRPDKFVPEDADRMIEEARNVAHLEKHPNTVEVYDVGRLDDGSCFVVLELIEGRSLQEELKQGKLSHERVLELILHVTAAIQHAHARGLVHRDLKPANILLDVDGNAHVADFGLAVSDDTQVHKAGEVSGTPAYMSPEQVRGDAHRLDGRTDIWAIGVILYEMLAGRRPFQGSNTEELFDEILHRDPKPPRQIEPKVPAALEAVCLKCLKKDAAERIGSATELAHNLRRATPQFQRTRRRRFALAGTVLACVLLALVTVPFLRGSKEPVIWVDPDAGFTVRPLHTLSGHTSEVWSVAFAPGDKVLASGGVDQVIKIWDVQAGKEQHQLSGHEAEVRCVAFGPNGQVLASSGNDGQVILWDTRQRQVAGLVNQHSGDVRAVTFSPDGTSIYSVGTDQIVLLSDPQTGDERQRYKRYEAAIQCVACSPDGTLLATGSDDHTVRLHDVETGDVRYVLAEHTDGITQVAFSHDGERLASASWDGTVCIWDLSNGNLILKLDEQTEAVRSVQFNPNGKHIATGGADYLIRFWDAETGKLVGTLPGHNGAVTSVAYSSDGAILASASGDKNVELWQIERTEPVAKDHSGPMAKTERRTESADTDVGQVETEPLPGIVPYPEKLPGILRWQIATRTPGRGIYSCDWSPGGRLIAYGDNMGAVRLVDSATLQVRRILLGHSGSRSSVAWSPDGADLVSTDAAGTVRLWNADGTNIQMVHNTGSFTWDVAWSPDGDHFATAHAHELRIWEKSGATVATFSVDAKCIDWSPDGRRMVTGDGSGTVHIWDTDGNERASIKLHATRVEDVAWNPDGSWLASAGKDGTVRLFDSSGRAGPVLKAADDDIRALAWSPDGSVLAFASGLGWVTFRNISERTEVTVQLRQDPVESIDWSPDGDRIVVATWDGLLQTRRADGAPEVTLSRHALTAWHSRSRPGSSQLATAWAGACAPDTGRQTNGLQFWESSGAPCSEFEQCPRFVTCLDFAPDGNSLLFSNGYTNDFWIRDVASGTDRTISGHTGGVWAVDWSPTGDRFASGSGDGNIRIWDASGRFLSEVGDHSEAVHALCWSPDGQLLASGSDDCTARLWRRDGTLEAVLEGHSKAVRCLSWSSDGRQLASGSDDVSVRLWETNGNSLRTLGKHAGGRCLDWSLDGRRLASGGFGCFSLWQGQDLLKSTFLPQLIGNVDSVAWHADSCHLAACEQGRGIVFWDIDSERIEWVGMMFEGGHPVTFAADGRLLYGDPDVVEKELVCVVERTPGGRQEMVPYSEIQQLLKRTE